MTSTITTTTTTTTACPSPTNKSLLSLKDGDIRLTLLPIPENTNTVSKLATRVYKQIQENNTDCKKLASFLEYYRVLTHFVEVCNSTCTKPVGPWTSKAKFETFHVIYETTTDTTAESTVTSTAAAATTTTTTSSTTTSSSELVLVDIARDIYYVEIPNDYQQSTSIKKERKNTLMGSIAFYIEGYRGANDIIHVNPIHGKKVAIKSFYKDLISRRISRDGKEIQENPMMELEIQQKISIPGHPNICKLLSCLETDESLFAVLPYLNGPDLYEAVKQRGHIPEKEATKIMLGIVNGIQYLHERNISHRDISLENIILTDNDIPVIIDFGVATVMKRKIITSTSNSSSDGGLFSKIEHTGPVGKKRYMAPELWVALDMTYWADKADIWSLGVTFFAMCVGYPPFGAPESSDANFVKAIKDRKLSYLFNKWKNEVPFHFDISNDMLQLLQTTMELRPISRPTLHEIVGTLEKMIKV
jgi:serine/threonine protein kinase